MSSDITLCKKPEPLFYADCLTCLRNSVNTKPNPLWQSYSEFKPIDGKCEYYLYHVISKGEF